MTRRSAVTAVAWLLTCAVCLAPNTYAFAAFAANGSGSSAGSATSMPSGMTPSGRASGSSLTVTWSAATFPDGTRITSYVIRRYDAVSGAESSVGAGCSGVVTATTCTEQSVPPGNWVYTDSPVRSNWIGAPSPASTPIIIT